MYKFLTFHIAEAKILVNPGQNTPAGLISASADKISPSDSPAAKTFHGVKTSGNISVALARIPLR